MMSHALPSRLSVLGLLALLVSVAGCQQREEPATAPRTFLTAGRIADIRQAIDVSGSHHQLAYAALRRRVETEGIAGYLDFIDAYKPGYKAREAALLAVLATSDDARQRYADIAYDSIEEMYTGPWSTGKKARRPDVGYGLSRAMMGTSMAMAYDWCRAFWTPTQRAAVEAHLDRALDAWPSYHHPNFGGVRGSNWVGVCRGAELWMIVSADQQERRAERYAYLRDELLKHIANGYSELGTGQEGIAYLEYTGTFLIPAALAAASTGDLVLLEAILERPWWKLAMYVQSFQDYGRRFTQWGVDHCSTSNAGWVSLLFAVTPRPMLPYYTWFYDRHMGRLASGREEIRFDGERAGAIWALLYYPEHLQPTDPTGVLPCLLHDSHGRYFFRNRWRDADDVQTTVMADTHHHGKAWDMPEALAINVLGFGHRFLGGPGKAGGNKKKDPAHAYFSALLVDGQYKPGRKQPANGALGWHVAEPQGGYVLVDGGEHYRQSLGVDSAQRHFLVSFAHGDDLALISTRDRISDDAEHRYTWQGNLGAEGDDDDGLQAAAFDAAAGGGRPGFHLQGADGGWLRGWVVHPADAEIEATGDPVRVSTSGTAADIWVVLLTGRGAVPAMEFIGTGAETVVGVDGASLRCAGDVFVYECGETVITAPDQDEP